ncbi:hypothetical protein, partial [Orientia tsutsugamushi]
AMERTAAITKREALERNINAGMGKFFPDIQQEAADLAGVVAALHSGDRNDSKLLMIDIQKKKIFLAI